MIMSSLLRVNNICFVKSVVGGLRTRGDKRLRPLFIFLEALGPTLLGLRNFSAASSFYTMNLIFKKQYFILQL